MFKRVDILAYLEACLGSTDREFILMAVELIEQKIESELVHEARIYNAELVATNGPYCGEALRIIMNFLKGENL